MIFFGSSGTWRIGPVTKYDTKRSDCRGGWRAIAVGERVSLGTLEC